MGLSKDTIRIMIVGMIIGVFGLFVFFIQEFEKIDKKLKIDCNLDPDNLPIYSECRDLQRDIISKTIDKDLLSNCIKLASLTDVNKLECYEYMEKNPGSTGNQVVDGILEQRVNYLNTPLN